MDPARDEKIAHVASKTPAYPSESAEGHILIRVLEAGEGWSTNSKDPRHRGLREACFAPHPPKRFREGPRMVHGRHSCGRTGSHVNLRGEPGRRLERACIWTSAEYVDFRAPKKRRLVRTRRQIAEQRAAWLAERERRDAALRASLERAESAESRSAPERPRLCQRIAHFLLGCVLFGGMIAMSALAVGIFHALLAWLGLSFLGLGDCPRCD
jgi:hypothetical protein